MRQTGTPGTPPVGILRLTPVVIPRPSQTRILLRSPSGRVPAPIRVTHPRMTRAPVEGRPPHDLARLRPHAVSGDVPRMSRPLVGGQGVGEPRLVAGDRPDPRLRHRPASFRG